MLKRADEAAAKLETSRSEMIRSAVEQMLDAMEKKELEAQLATAYEANARMNQDLLKEFNMMDQEGW